VLVRFRPGAPFLEIGDIAVKWEFASSGDADREHFLPDLVKKRRGLADALARASLIAPVVARRPILLYIG
jgi:hypothetical protein